MASEHIINLDNSSFENTIKTSTGQIGRAHV